MRGDVAPLDPDLREKLEPLRRLLWGTRNAVVPVVGSGLSQGLLSWKDLLSDLIRQLPASDQGEPRETLDSGEYLEVAQYVEDHPAVGAAVVQARIKAAFQRPSESEPAEYELVAALPTEHYLTTNFDPWLKNAVSRRLGAAPRVYGPHDAGAFSDIGPESPPLVLMIHGDADRPETCMLGFDAYRRLAHGTAAWHSGLAQLVGQRHLLFIGYSLSDPDLLLLLDEWQEIFAPSGGAPRHTVLLDHVSTMRRSRLRRSGVEPIELEDYVRLPAVLRFLAEPPAGHVPKPPDPAREALRAYLRRVRDETATIDIQGIGTRQGRGRSALSYPIEELYTPLRTRRLAGRGAPDEATDREEHSLASELVTLDELLPHHRWLLIEGQPGAGKTTFQRLVAAMLARDALGISCQDGAGWARRYLGLEPGDLCPETGADSSTSTDADPVVPVLLRAQLLVPLLQAHDGPPDRAALVGFIERLCCDADERVPARVWSDRLASGQAVLLLDGVDEVADSVLRTRLFAVLKDAQRGFGCRIIATSRPIDTDTFTALGFVRAVVEPFGRDEIKSFIERWVRGLRARDDLDGASGAIADHQRQLEDAILSSVSIRRLAENPVMLTCLAVVHFNEGRLPEARARLYQAVMGWLVRARTERRRAQAYSDEFTRRALASLALSMMVVFGGKRAAVSFGEAIEILSAEFLREFPDAPENTLYRAGELWLEFECEASGIVQELPGRQLRFWHLTFEEYLAALALSWQVASGEDWLNTVLHNLEDIQWRETLDLLPGVLFDGPGVGAVDQLLQRVVAARGGDRTLAGQARLAALLSRFLEPLEAYEYRAPARIRDALEGALESSLAIFTLEGSREVPVRLRIEVADALGRGGDPRFASGKGHFLPLPGTGTALGEYPVTVEEYRHFVDDRGYDTPRFWSAEGWEKRATEGWESPRDWEEQLEHPNRPVVGVSFHETEAYAQWRSELTGRGIRLPTGDEWSAAATTPSGEYPWGEVQPSEELLNFLGQVGHPTPVGIYPAGAGPRGHLDIAGNVWEWTSDVHDGQFRVIRGGSWDYDAWYCRSAQRGRGLPVVRGNNLGFRLAADLPR